MRGWRQHRRTHVVVMLTAVTLGVWLLPAFVAVVRGGPTDADQKGMFTVKGEVVDLWCYLDHKGHGEKHKSCAVTCAEAGNPIGIVDDAGQIYMAMGGKKHQPGRDVLIQHMAETVTATGRLVKMGGVQAIYVTSVKQ